MSNSRRGLLAAGLAAAVVGSMGVVWTLNADAAETPEVEAPVAVVAPVADADAEPLLTPPSLLPWGSKPAPLTRAKAGAGSEAIAAAGADAAPADASGSLVPEPEFAPKGQMVEDIAPPAPPRVAEAGVLKAAAADDGKPAYNYAGALQKGETDGSWANLTIEKPKLVGGDYHSLAEIAVQTEFGEQAVEVGWTVDPGVNNKDVNPHLFVFYWKDHVAQCYNACGWVQYDKLVKPGATLPYPAQKRFGIQHSGGAWWIAYDSAWIGAFPDTNWEGRFTKGQRVQWFGEIASPPGTKPCSPMGSGLAATDDNAARIGSITMTNGPVLKFESLQDVDEDKTKVWYYKYQWRSETTFAYGGPGPC